MKKHLSGSIYIVTNPSMPGIVKISDTQEVKSRLHQLNKERVVPTPFQLEFEYELSDVVQVKKLIHNELHHQRVDIMREFFVVSIERAIEITVRMIQKVAEDPLCYQRLFPKSQKKWDEKTVIQVVKLYQKMPDITFISSIIGRSFVEVEMLLNYVGVVRTTQFPQSLPYVKGIPRNCYHSQTFSLFLKDGQKTYATRE
ncbi:MAG TPA: GIY-YIG nuclease family protein [Massilibacterium sp.]|nr:GIY-YIG nuclease family protein [Massilibacterium sp.]